MISLLDLSKNNDRGTVINKKINIFLTSFLNNIIKVKPKINIISGILFPAKTKLTRININIKRTTSVNFTLFLKIENKRI